MIFLVFLLLASPAWAEPRRVVRVLDGDTVEITGPDLPKELPNLRLRVLGVDTPEKGHLAKCPKEKASAAGAKAFTEQFISSGRVVVILRKWDKYGGRVLGDVIVDGKPLSKALVEEGYAAPYWGRGAKRDWCSINADQ